MTAQDWYFQQDGHEGLDSLGIAGDGPLLPRYFDHALFNRIADEVAPGWRAHRAKARAEADMLWHNQGLTHLSPVCRAGLTMLSEGLQAALGGAKT
jgi:hypothetical protein